MREFARVTEEMSVSVLNLQEVHTYRLLGELKAGLKSFPYVAYKPGLFGPRAGLVTFSRVPLVEIKFYRLSLHKGVLISRLRDEPITILNVHLIANKDGDWSSGNRHYLKEKAQLESLQNWTQGLAGDGVVIASGDFNLARTCDLFEEFIKHGGWNDAFADNPSPTFHKEFLPAGREPQCIDYLLYKSGSLRHEDAKVLFQNKLMDNGKAYLSDHMGLYARFR
jgi:endonuclease/exonuclease/phosphatase family metal-dependent hydrolase